MDKKSLSERDICTKFITPAIIQAGWDIEKQVREEFSFTVFIVVVFSLLWINSSNYIFGLELFTL